jgi:FKBP-type peptidyl-prolyl cis-trans isomerase
MTMRNATFCFLFLAFSVFNPGCSSGEGKSTHRYGDGLIVEILEPGTGVSVEKGQTVVMHYTGWLDAGGWKKGNQFDSSLDRGRPFPVTNIGSGRVIKGWNLGIAPSAQFAGMKKGEKRRLKIPAALGYGARGAGSSIPPNANLIFDVELLEIQ